MFGKSNGQAPQATRPAASDVALVQSRLTHILIGDSSSIGHYVFLNGAAIPPEDVESVTIEIIAPTDSDRQGSLTAILSRYETGPTGVRAQRAVSLFPGTVEIVARGRRLVVTCEQENTFEGLWLGIGMRADGTSSELTGVQSLRFAASSGLLDAKLVWSEDGTTEDLLPE